MGMLGGKCSKCCGGLKCYVPANTDGANTDGANTHGACCKLDGTCSIEAQCDCDTASGEFFNAGHSCEDTDCSVYCWKYGTQTECSKYKPDSGWETDGFKYESKAACEEDCWCLGVEDFRSLRLSVNCTRAEFCYCFDASNNQPDQSRVDTGSYSDQLISWANTLFSDYNINYNPPPPNLTGVFYPFFFDGDTDVYECTRDQAVTQTDYLGSFAGRSPTDPIPDNFAAYQEGINYTSGTASLTTCNRLQGDTFIQLPAGNIDRGPIFQTSLACSSALGLPDLYGFRLQGRMGPSVELSLNEAGDRAYASKTITTSVADAAQDHHYHQNWNVPEFYHFVVTLRYLDPSAFRGYRDWVSVYAATVEFNWEAELNPRTNPLP